MELTLRLKFKELSDPPPAFTDNDGKMTTIEDFPLTEQERADLIEALTETLKGSTFFINWGHDERAFVIGISNSFVNL